jgi:hypothetical protein
VERVPLATRDPCFRKADQFPRLATLRREVVIVVRGLSESGMNPMKIEIGPLNDHALQRIN